MIPGKHEPSLPTITYLPTSPTASVPVRGRVIVFLHASPATPSSKVAHYSLT